MNWNALWKATKEPLRLLLMAFVSYAITQLAKMDNPTEFVMLFTLLLRFVDKLMYEAGKAKGSDKLAGGLTRF